MASTGNSWAEISFDSQSTCLALCGSWRISKLPEIESELESLVSNGNDRWIIDGESLTEIDTAGAMAMVRFVEDRSTKIPQLKFENFKPAHLNILGLAKHCVDLPEGIEPPSYGFWEKLGRDSLELVHTVAAILGFVGATATEFFRLSFTPGALRVKEFCVQLEQTGLNAIPICALLTFLIGIVIAYLTGIQLERYGANIFIVDSVSIAMCRELSPILVAITVAGRSGSAFTAQIGTMKLNEEIDAMHALGLSPMRVLVLPRILALIVAIPLLVFVGDLAGIMGGMLIADLRLDVTGATFLARLRNVLELKHVIVGLIKAPVFAFFIATIGCRMGLQVENNAYSVGLNTTQTVVRSIVAVILINAAFAVLLSELGI